MEPPWGFECNASTLGFLSVTQTPLCRSVTLSTELTKNKYQGKMYNTPLWFPPKAWIFLEVLSVTFQSVEFLKFNLIIGHYNPLIRNLFHGSHCRNWKYLQRLVSSFGLRHWENFWLLIICGGGECLWWIGVVCVRGLGRLIITSTLPYSSRMVEYDVFAIWGWIFNSLSCRRIVNHFQSLGRNAKKRLWPLVQILRRLPNHHGCLLASCLKLSRKKHLLKIWSWWTFIINNSRLVIIFKGCIIHHWL